MSEANGISILYMEDDLGIARLVQKALKREGYDVTTAADGGEGLEQLRAGNYDLCIVDYNMPVYNGVEVLQQIADEEMDIPTIMLTGAGDETVAVEAMKLGALDYMVKDVNGGYLTLAPAVIERVLEQMRLQQAKKEWEEERERLIQELQEALSSVKTLSGLLPICANCKKIRDDTGYWNKLESYLKDHSDANFSHAICPECAKELYPELVNPPETKPNEGS